jgi:hypothetical protein
MTIIANKNKQDIKQGSTFFLKKQKIGECRTI